MPTAVVVGTLFASIGIGYAIIGGHALNCWIDSPRETNDLDLAIAELDFNLAIVEMARNFPELISPYQPHRGEGRYKINDARKCDAVDLIRADQGAPLLPPTIEHAVEIAVGQDRLRIANIESMIALKAIAILDDDRSKAKREQDVSDFSGLALAPGVRHDLLAELSVIWRRSYPRMLSDMVRDSRGGGDADSLKRLAKRLSPDDRSARPDNS
jgi:hypothetical protein